MKSEISLSSIPLPSKPFPCQLYKPQSKLIYLFSVTLWRVKTLSYWYPWSWHHKWKSGLRIALCMLHSNGLKETKSNLIMMLNMTLVISDSQKWNPVKWNLYGIGEITDLRFIRDVTRWVTVQHDHVISNLQWKQELTLWYYNVTGATCTICNVLHCWSREQKTNNRTMFPTLKTIQLQVIRVQWKM